MKVKGKLQDSEIVLLIDSGATHNFISEELQHHLKLATNEIAEYSITVGDGHVLKRKQRCRDLQITVQGFKIIQTFYLFPLKGVDAVLGMEWLRSLGEVKVD